MRGGRLGAQRYEMFASGLLLMLSFFSFLLSASYMMAVMMLAGLLVMWAAVSRLAAIYGELEMKKSLEEAIVVLALALLTAYFAGYSELVARPLSAISMIFWVPDFISRASISQLPPVMMYFGLSTIFSGLLISSMRSLSVKSGERLYLKFAYLISLSLLLLAPSLLLAAGATILFSSFAGRLRLP